MWYLILAVGLAILVPVALITTGAELRKVRLRIVEDLRDTVFMKNPQLPQLKLALARYDRARTADDRPSRQDEVKQWAGAFIYALVSFFGFVVLFTPVAALLNGPGHSPGVTETLFWLPEWTAPDRVDESLRRSVAVAGMAFLGGYVFNMRYLVRQTLNQELSALAFVRSAIRLLQGIIFAIVVYQVGATALPAATGTPPSDAASGGFALALGVAFILGYFPDLGLAKIAKWARVHVKSVDRDALKNARIIPLEIIDGIDHEVSFRLQESNIYDVQNLAVANPVELYAETPYTLLQTFDWVLQAQLCLVTGVQAFSELKRHKIRTIFDLERAFLSSGVPDDYRRALCSVVLADASECFRKGIGLPPKPNDCDAATASEITVRHLIAITCDDLHVHRLRALWVAIMSATAGVNETGKPLWLFEVGWLPGDPKLAEE